MKYLFVQHTHTQQKTQKHVLLFLIKMSRVLIDYCPIEELMSLPGVGAKVADTILEMWEAKGDLELEGLRHVPYLRLTLQLIRCLDFAPLDDGEELGERSGSLDEEHRERDRSVDQLVEEWEGAGPGLPQGTEKGWGQLSKVPSKEGKSYQLKQEGE